MVDVDLKNYIHSLLKEGYDIEEIKAQLAKAGHDMRKVEDLSLSVFKIFHKELFDYIESETTKGKNVDDIRRDLLNVGHSEKKIKQILHYHRKGKSVKNKIDLHEIYHEEKKWFSSWINIFVVIFSVMLLILSLLTIPLVMQDSIEDKAYSDNMAICQELFNDGNLNNKDVQTFNALCRAFVESDINMCNILPENVNDCIDAHRYYTFLDTKDGSLCKLIKDPTLSELCEQINERNCNNYYGFEAQCLAIVNELPTECDVVGQNQFAIIGNCRDQYHLYMSVKNDNIEECSKVNNKNLNGICRVMIN